MILTVGKCINICDSSSNDEIWTTILERKGLRKMHIKLRSRVILANYGLMYEPLQILAIVE